MPCPCGSGKEYEVCCGPFHSGASFAPTAEKLMRSRYCAFVKREISYLKDTTWPAYQKHFDEAGYTARAETSIWIGLTVHETGNGGEDDARGTVTFTAKSMVNGQITEQSEKSMFKKKAGRWYYVKAVG